jgi:flagellum-specific peptidoglycan hydrolase FlgJ
MQIPRVLLPVCVAAFGMAALPLLADDNATQSAPPAAKSQKTTADQTEIKKQAEANAQTRKEADMPAKAEAEANNPADAPAQAQAQTKAKAEQGKPEKSARRTQSGKQQAAFKPIERPALPISADKAERLTELLRKYRADEITPEQYQKERAKILAEP